MFIYPEHEYLLNGLEMHAEIAFALRERLAEYDAEISLPLPLANLEADEPVHGIVRASGQQHACSVVYAPDIRATSKVFSGEQNFGPPLLILGDRVQARSAEALRRSGINYLDAAGNAYLRFSGLLIDVRGRKVDLPTRERRTGPTNLFSVKRAQVIFVLFEWPELVDAPLRVVAATSGVSLGQVQDTFSVLAEAGFLMDGGTRRLRNVSFLFEQWVAAFSTGIGAPSRQHAFHGDIERFSAGDERGIYLSGEAAVPELIHPETATIYTESSPMKLAAFNRWRRDALPNIFVRPKFWTAPEDTDEYLRAPHVSALRRAPAALIYADLMASNEGRQREVAQAFRDSDDRLRRL